MDNRVIVSVDIAAAWAVCDVRGWFVTWTVCDVGRFVS